MTALIILFIILIIALAFTKPLYAIELVIAYQILIPFYTSIIFLGKMIAPNFWLPYILFLIITPQVILRKKFLPQKKISILLLSFLLPLLFGIFYGTEIPIATQLRYFITYILTNFSLGYLYFIQVKKEKDLQRLFVILYIVLGISSVYGIYCGLTRSNPYVYYANNFNLLENNNSIQGVETYLNEDRGGLKGRITSTMAHPMTWAATSMISVFLFLFIGYLYPKKIYRKINTVLIPFMIVNVFLTGTRSAIIPLFASLVVLAFILKWKFKWLIVLSVPLVISILFLDPKILHSYSGFLNSIMFFWSENESKGITGSSWTMRYTQLMGAIELFFGSSIFWGRGFGWVSEYLKVHGPHPILLAFEGIFFVSIIESGLVGVFSWLFFFYKQIKISVKYIKKKIDRKNSGLIFLLFIISYFFFISITGLCMTLNYYFFILLVFIKITMVKKRGETHHNASESNSILPSTVSSYS